MALRMLAFAIAGVIEHRRRRRCPAERLVVTDIDPASRGIGLALGQHRHGRVITMQAFGRHDMRRDEAQHRIERGATRSHGVGHRREADRHAFQSIAPGLPVQRLMLAELLEQDHRQEAWACPAPGDRLERGRRLADLLAIPAGVLFSYGFDRLRLARDHFQGAGHILA